MGRQRTATTELRSALPDEGSVISLPLSATQRDRHQTRSRRRGLGQFRPHGGNARWWAAATIQIPLVCGRDLGVTLRNGIQGHGPVRADTENHV